jgi:hypothetical protein
MTHDELLALLKPMTNDDAIFMKDALRAVVQLHKPEGNSEQQCEHDKKTYPCPTIQAITKELG